MDFVQEKLKKLMEGDGSVKARPNMDDPKRNWSVNKKSRMKKTRKVG